MIRIGINGSGGDFGIKTIGPAVVKAAQDHEDLEVVLYSHLPMLDFRVRNLECVNCRSANDELHIALYDLSMGKLDAIITASNSARLLAATKSYLQDGIKRPGLMSPCPVKGKTAYMLDVGATARVNDPEVFLGWAKVGYHFLTADLKIADPKIGLLNIAAERAHPELARIHQALQSHQGYVGYAEPALFFRGEIDLWLMEGFVGNAFLKLIEEVLSLTFSSCLKELAGIPVAQLRLHKMAETNLSYDAHLVSPLLGLTGTVFRVHGRCQADQITRSFQAIEQYLYL